MSRSFLIVLPKEMRSGVAPAASAMLDLDDRGACRSTSRARPAAAAPPAPGWPSRRRTRACPAARGRRRRSCRARRRGRRRGTGRRRGAVAQEIADAVGHGALSPRSNGETVRVATRVGDAERSEPPGVSGIAERRRARWRHGGRRASDHPMMLPWIGTGRPRSARLAREDKPLRCRPLEGRRDQKSPFRRCFKPRPPWRAGFAGFASGCRSWFGTRYCCREPSPVGIPPRSVPILSLAAVRPLVRMPTDRHATTGTCEIGQGGYIGVFAPRHKSFFVMLPRILTRRQSQMLRKRRASRRDERCGPSRDRPSGAPIPRRAVPMPVCARRSRRAAASEARPRRRTSTLHRRRRRGPLAWRPARRRQRSPRRAGQPPARFGFEDVVRRARELADGALRRHAAAAARAAQPSSTSTPTATSASAPTGRCSAARRPVPACSMFHLGFLYHAPGDRQRHPRRHRRRRSPYSAALFDYGRNKFERPLPVNLGFAGFRLHYPLNDPKVLRRADLVPRRELFPLPRPRPALRPLGARARRSTSGDGHRGIPGLPGVLDRAARARRRPRRRSTRCSTAPSLTGAYQFDVYPGERDGGRRPARRCSRASRSRGSASRR